MSDITVRMNRMDKKINNLKAKIKDIEHSCEFDGCIIEEFDKKQKEKMLKFEQEQKAKESELRSEITDLQSRSMRDNLLFCKIAEEKDEDCETKILDFVENKLKLVNAKSVIKFHRAHKIWTYKPDRIRPIAKFAYYPGREKVRRALKELKGTPYGISEQFPKEVMIIHRKLIPATKQARQEGKDAHLAVDKFINKGLYVA